LFGFVTSVEQLAAGLSAIPGLDAAATLGLGSAAQLVALALVAVAIPAPDDPDGPDAAAAVLDLELRDAADAATPGLDVQDAAILEEGLAAILPVAKQSEDQSIPQAARPVILDQEIQEEILYQELHHHPLEAVLCQDAEVVPDQELRHCLVGIRYQDAEVVPDQERHHRSEVVLCQDAEAIPGRVPLVLPVQSGALVALVYVGVPSSTRFGCELMPYMVFYLEVGNSSQGKIVLERENDPGFKCKTSDTLRQHKSSAVSVDQNPSFKNETPNSYGVILKLVGTAGTPLVKVKGALLPLTPPKTFTAAAVTVYVPLPKPLKS
jgi:hypothetical protein